MSQVKDKKKSAASKPKDELPAVYADPKNTPLKANVPSKERLEFKLRKGGGT